jgi:hypothetical protein
VDQIREGASLQPQLDSPASGELAEEKDWASEGAWGTEPVRQAHRFPIVLLSYAEDAWTGLDQLMDYRPTSRVAVVSTVRSGIEHASRAWWLLDPDIDCRTRVARHMNERIYGLLEVKRLPDEVRNQLLAEAPWYPEGPSDLDERLREIRETGSQFGFELKKGGWLVEERPGARAVIRAVFDWAGSLGDTIYTYYSSIIHPTTMGAASGLVLAPDLAESGGALASISSSPELLYHLLIGSLLAYLGAMDRLVKLYGWDLWAWDGWHDHARRTMVELMEKHQQEVKQATEANGER